MSRLRPTRSRGEKPPEGGGRRLSSAAQPRPSGRSGTAGPRTALLRLELRGRRHLVGNVFQRLDVLREIRVFHPAAAAVQATIEAQTFN